MRPTVRGLVVGLFAFVIVSCASPDEAAVKKDYSRPLPEGVSGLELVTDPARYPDFRSMYRDLPSLERAIDQSLDFFSKPSSQNHFPFDGFSHERNVRSLKAMKQIVARARTPEEFSGYVHLNFDVYRSIGWDGSGEVLFTAYYQPIFWGSREPVGEFVSPLYGLPDDLVKAEDGTCLGRQTGEEVVPYYTRSEIEDARRLDGRDLELVYVKDPLDAFIIHVQGSAKIRLTEDDTMHIGYAGKNEHEYTSIGRALVEDGKIDPDELSLSKIRDHFDRHPEELAEYLGRNESYVFFTETGPGGPYGSLGAPVTAYRTIATDKSVFPRGGLCAIETRVPELEANGRLLPRPYNALVLDQDTGGAIRSAGRCDFFVGTGHDAELIAGHTKYEGKLFYLFVKEDSPLGLGDDN